MVHSVAAGVMFMLLACTPGSAHSDISPGAEADTSESPVVEIGDGIYRVGNVLINTATRAVQLPGAVNMHTGLVELLACTPTGKTHESVLALDVNPCHLQVALLLLGLECGQSLSYQGEDKRPEGDSIIVWVEWQNCDGTTTKIRGEKLLWNGGESRTMEDTEWVFSGSRIVNGVFMAGIEGSLITTYHDPYTILDNPAPSGADDTLFYVNETLTPPEGTPVVVTLVDAGYSRATARTADEAD